jgi:hypothetical protein
MTTGALSDDTYRMYWEAIRRRVCSIRLDCADDGTCGLTGGRRCAIETHLPKLVPLLLRVRSGRMDEYNAAVEAEICGECNEDAAGVCPLRRDGECALSLYLPLLLEAVEEVDARRDEPPARHSEQAYRDPQIFRPS